MKRKRQRRRIIRKNPKNRNELEMPKNVEITKLTTRRKKLSEKKGKLG